MNFQGFSNLVSDGHRRVQGGHRILENHSYLDTSKLVCLSRREIQYVLTVKRGRAGGNFPGWHRNQPHEGLNGN